MQSITTSLSSPTGSFYVPTEPNLWQLDGVRQWCSSYGCSYFLGTLASVESSSAESSESTFDCYLSQAEIERSNRYANLLDRQNFRIRRSLLRSILANETNTPIADVKLSTDAFGKPILAADEFQLDSQDDSNLHFSQSSSYDRVFIGIHRDFSIGVDVEYQRELSDLGDVAKVVFHPIELNHWQDLPSRHRLTWLYDTWALKESILKCIGCGLLIEPSTFCVQPSLSFQEIQLDDMNDCHRTVLARNIAVLDGYSLAIAIEPQF